MKANVFDKTDKGREEIATRTYQLPPRMRTLLLLIDGRQSGADALEKVAGLGLNEENLQQLMDGGYIRQLPAAPLSQAAASCPQSPPADPPKAGENEPLPTDSTAQYQALYRFYTETIRSTIGLRGYALQLKVEKADSVAALEALRGPYLEAVRKAKGNEVALGLAIRLDRLFGMAAD